MTEMIWQVVVVVKKSVSAGFALPVKKMILWLPGFTHVYARAPLSGSTRFGYKTQNACGSIICCRFASNGGLMRNRKGTTARVSCVHNVAPIISYRSES